MRGRYAPSPTGAMHLGNARTALLAWLDARRLGGAFVMRVEDLDRARIVDGAEARLLADLRWLGLDWDEGPDRGPFAEGCSGPAAGPFAEGCSVPAAGPFAEGCSGPAAGPFAEGCSGPAAGPFAEGLSGPAGPFAPYRQSERGALYDDAVDRLLAAGRAFPCACSRADIARAATAPHAEDEDEPRYPGTCRGLPAFEVVARAAAQGRRPSLRYAAGGEADVDRGVDDFVLRRADGVASYQLAVVVDDIAMRITRVVRGDDLLRSTPRQLALYRAFGAAPPAFVHVPLVLAPGGERLAKRTRPPSIASLRERGVDPAVVVGALAASAGLGPPGGRASPGALVDGFDWARVPATPVTIDADALT